MKKQLFLPLFALCFQWLQAQDIVRLKFSKPFALLKFFDTAKGSRGTSITLKEQMDSSKVLQNGEFKALVRSYQTLQLDNSYSKRYYPEKRKHTTSTWDLLCIAAISSATNDEFLSRIIGILPNDDYLKLKQVLIKGEPFYDAFIFKGEQAAIQAKLADLKTFEPKLNLLFEKFKVFYGSSWDKAVPFNLTIYPIYGQTGQTTATPHANSLEMGFLLKDKNNNDMVAVGMHEMCHVLFEEQPLALQLEIDSLFSTANPYAKLAYRYIDEALATSLGNGYAYKYLSGEMDAGEWYSDTYIDRYAKALYPLTSQYLEEHKPMDKAFVLKAIDLFKQTFPDALYDIDALMMRSDLYFEDDISETVDGMINTLDNTFRIYMSNTSIPIDDPASIENIKNSEHTQVLVIHRNQAKNLKLLKTLFPELKKLPKQTNMLVSFLDEKNRPVIIVLAENATKANEGISLLKKKGKIDPKQLWEVF